MSVNHSNLTINQVRCISALLSYPTIDQAADEIGVNSRTIYRWMNEPVFVAALRAAESLAIGDHVRGLVVDLENNRRVMFEIRDNTRYSPAVRLRAAGMIDQSLLKWRQLQDLETAIVQIERRLDEIENRQTNKTS